MKTESIIAIEKLMIGRSYVDIQELAEELVNIGVSYNDVLNTVICDGYHNFSERELVASYMAACMFMYNARNAEVGISRFLDISWDAADLEQCAQAVNVIAYNYGERIFKMAESICNFGNVTIVVFRDSNGN